VDEALRNKLAEAHQARIDCDHERARPLYEEVLQAEPDLAEAHWGYGLVLGFLGEFEASLEQLKAACAGEHQEAQHVYDLAMTQMMLGEYDAAKPSLERAIELDETGVIAEKAKKQLSYFK